HWNEANLEAARRLDPTPRTRELESAHAGTMEERRHAAERLVAAWRGGDDPRAQAALSDLERLEGREAELRGAFQARLRELAPNDKDYVFLSYVMDHLPAGVIGLLLAMIFCAGMSSTSAELSALATTCTVDLLRTAGGETAQVRATRRATVVCGLVVLGFAAL